MFFVLFFMWLVLCLTCPIKIYIHVHIHTNTHTYIHAHILLKVRLFYLALYPMKGLVVQGLAHELTKCKGWKHPC